MKKYDVVTIGDAFEDLFVFSKDFKIVNDRSFKSGKSLSFDYGAKNDIDKLEYHTGGSAMNSALCFSKLELNVAIITFLGSDSVGEKISSSLKNNNIDFKGIIKAGTSTNTSIILSCKGDRTILSYHGDNNYNQLSLPKSLAANWFYLAPIGDKFYDLENNIIANIAKNGSGLIWNPGPTQIKKGVKSYRHLLQLCNIIILNKEEALSLSGVGNSIVEDSMRILNDYGAKVVVVTDGKNGARVFDGKIFIKISATNDNRVDATGAGDAFASTFSARIIKDITTVKTTGFVPGGETICEALKWAIVNSGSVVGSIGANAGLLNESEIIKKSDNLVRLEPEVYT